MSGECSPALTSSRRWRSVRQTPAARTCTRTSSARGCGFGSWMSLIAPPDSNRTARTESPLVPSLTKQFALSLGCLCGFALARPGATAIAKYPKYVRARARGFPGGNRKHVGPDAWDSVLALGDCGRADV